MANNPKKTFSCPVETTLDVIGGRWKVLVLHFLLDGAKRFGELTRALGGISARTLAKQLRELERDGVIHRRDFQEIPPKVEYSLTPIGRRLEPVLVAMAEWGQQIARRPRAQLGRSLPPSVPATALSKGSNSR
jgi:DNA-binding HxlR family transcriptional regulator